MTEWPHSQHYGQLGYLTHLKELSQTTLPTPIEHALGLLDMVPEHIAGDDGHATLFHLPHFPTPLVGRDARIVHFTHHRTDTPSVDHQTILIPCNHRHLCHCYQRQDNKP